MSVAAVVLARLEREYGSAREVAGLAARMTAACIGAPAGAVLVDCGDGRVVAILDGVEVLYDVNGPLR